jgi:sulfonate transport system permease protein
MTKWRIDRTSIFLCVIGLLFLWDLAYFAGIIDPTQVPHPFHIFQMIGNFTFLRGFGNTLRQIIFFTLSGYCLGIAIASLALHSSTLARTALRFLRLGFWLPFLIFFAVAQSFIILGITAVILCSCYHYLVARLLLGFSRREAWIYVARAAFLQAFFFSLIGELWWTNWLSNWMALFKLSEFTKAVTVGAGVCATVLVFLFLVNWFFRFNFDSGARMRRTIVREELNGASWNSFWRAFLLVVACFLLWQAISPWRLNFLYSSPLEVLRAGSYLFRSGEIWNDIRLSLLEVVGGMVLGGSMGMMALWFLSTNNTFGKLMSLLLPLTYISPIVMWLLWQFIFYRLDNYQYLPLLFHRLVFVGALAFYPFVEAFWGLHGRPLPYRILLAVDYALPIAFVAMLLGELYAATAGLGFVMVIATAVRQTDKGLLVFLLTVALLVALSVILRSIAKRLDVSERSAEVAPAHAS